MKDYLPLFIAKKGTKFKKQSTNIKTVYEPDKTEDKPLIELIEESIEPQSSIVQLNNNEINNTLCKLNNNLADVSATLRAIYDFMKQQKEEAIATIEQQKQSIVKPHRPVAPWRQAAHKKTQAIANVYADRENIEVKEANKKLYNMLYHQLEEEAGVNLDVLTQELSKQRTGEKVTRMDAIEASEKLTRIYQEIVTDIYNNFFDLKDTNIKSTTVIDPLGSAA
jgi:hypothetical protein